MLFLRMSTEAGSGLTNLAQRPGLRKFLNFSFHGYEMPTEDQVLFYYGSALHDIIIHAFCKPQQFIYKMHKYYIVSLYSSRLCVRTNLQL